IWHALYSVECTLLMATGRPRIIREVDCSVPVPGTFLQHSNDVETDAEGLVVPDPYLKCQRIIFAIISDGIAQLYHAKGQSRMFIWYHDVVERLEARLQQWKDEVPPELQWDMVSPMEHTENVVQRQKC